MADLSAAAGPPASEPPGPPPPPPAAVLACPHCLQAVAFDPADAGGIAICPHCDWEFPLPADAAPNDALGPDGFVIVDDAPPPAEPPPRRGPEDDVDAMRIRQVVNLRRTAYRHRSHFLMLSLACGVLGVHFIVETVRRVVERQPLELKHWAYPLIAVVLVRWGLRAYKRAVAYGEEAVKSSIPVPQTPPSFDELSDGSQHWQNLEKLK